MGTQRRETDKLPRGTDTGSVEIADADTRSVFLTLLLAALGSPLQRFV
jgi:hypothetical protein